QKYRQYINVLERHIRYLIVNHKASIVMIPQVIGPSVKEDDRKTLDAIKEKFSSYEIENNFIIINDDYSPRQLKFIYSKLDLLVGTRLHSCIFSLSEGVPCLNIAYHGTKSQGIMSDLGLGSFVFSIDKVSEEELNASIDLILNDKLQLVK